MEFKDTESYSKMVKLALARFQQYSAPYAYLSPVSSWVFQPIGPDRTISFGVVSEINEDPLRPSRQIRFAIGGNSPGNLAEGYRKNSLQASLFDGENTVSEFQEPLKIDAAEAGFTVPLNVLQRLKRPSVHVKKFEYIGNGDTRLVFACQIPIDPKLFV